MPKKYLSCAKGIGTVIMTHNAGKKAAGRFWEYKRREADFLVVLAGNPNTGKSTIFNALTKNSQHTGNWAGKTVSIAQGFFRMRGYKIKLVDLPGTYSLLAASVEERVARDFIFWARPDATVVVADATCLERNLNLVLQVLELEQRVAVCLNFMDEAAKKKIHIDCRALAGELGVPVVPVAARDKRGLEQLTAVIFELACGRLAVNPRPVKYHESLENAVSQLEPAIKELAGDDINSRWLALRLLEGDRGAAAILENWLLREENNGFEAKSAKSIVKVLSKGTY